MSHSVRDLLGSSFNWYRAPSISLLSSSASVTLQPHHPVLVREPELEAKGEDRKEGVVRSQEASASIVLGRLCVELVHL